MAITKKQQQLDIMKWKKSEELGADACGTFDFCIKCDKSLENPCDKAYRKFHEKPKAAKKTNPGVKETKSTAVNTVKPATATKAKSESKSSSKKAK